MTAKTPASGCQECPPTELGLEPAQPVLSIRASVPQGEAGEFIANALHDVRIYLHEHHMQAVGPPFSIRRPRGSEIDIEAGWPTTAPLAGTGRIHGGALPRSLLDPHTAGPAFSL